MKRVVAPSLHSSLAAHCLVTDRTVGFGCHDEEICETCAGWSFPISPSIRAAFIDNEPFVRFRTGCQNSIVQVTTLRFVSSLSIPSALHRTAQNGWPTLQRDGV